MTGSSRRGPRAPRPEVGTLASVPGLSVGQVESPEGATGVSAVLFDRPAPTVVDIRGGASGTFDTASLALDATFGMRLAIFLAGGSLYGLDAASGVRRAILERGGGVRVFDHPVPVVPISGAILFDLARSSRELPDYARLGYRAARSADRSAVRTGRVGAGAGASIGKYLGRAKASPGGVGTAAAPLGDLGWVGVLVAVNSVGAIRDPADGRYVAGPRGPRGEIVPFEPFGAAAREVERQRGTTLAVVATDVAMGRPGLQRLAVYAHDGLAHAIVPAHTATDGDVVFVSSTGSLPSRRTERYPGANADRVGAAVQQLMIRAILAAVSGPGAGRRRPSSEAGSREARG